MPRLPEVPPPWGRTSVSLCRTRTFVVWCPVVRDHLGESRFRSLPVGRKAGVSRNPAVGVDYHAGVVGQPGDPGARPLDHGSDPHPDDGAAGLGLLLGAFPPTGVVGHFHGTGRSQGVLAES